MDETVLKEVEGKVDGFVDEGGAKLPLKPPQDGGVGVVLPPGPLPSLAELLPGHPQGIKMGSVGLLVL